jgi:hypothetical protein
MWGNLVNQEFEDVNPKLRQMCASHSDFGAHKGL